MVVTIVCSLFGTWHKSKNNGYNFRLADDLKLNLLKIYFSSAICGARATTEITGDGKRLRCLGRRGSDFFSAGESNK